MRTIPPVVLAGADEFGIHIRTLLEQRVAHVTSSIADSESLFAEAEGPVVIATGLPLRGLLGQADRWAFEYGKSWLPIVMDHPHVRVGPFVVPGSGPCFGCFEERIAQRDPEAAVTDSLSKAWENGQLPAAGGLLSHHARLAVALAELILAGNPQRWAGALLSFNVMGSGVRHHRVTPYGRCTRCAGGDTHHGVPLLDLISECRRSQADSQASVLERS